MEYMKDHQDKTTKLLQLPLLELYVLQLLGHIATKVARKIVRSFTSRIVR